MKKALTFLSAFVVSFVIIYSIYYYSKPAQLRYLDKGFTAKADTLKHTLVRPHPYEPSSTKNIIYDAGLIRALQKAGIPVSAANINEDINILNEEQHVAYEGVYNEAALSKMNTDLKQKFPNHPPLEFKSMGQGKEIIFSYVFRNAFYPRGFQESSESMKFKGKNIKAIVYTAGDEGSKNAPQLFLSPDKKSYAIKIALDKDEEAVWAYSPGMQDVASADKKALELMQPENIYKPAAGEQVFMPVLDFFLEKDFTNKELADYFSPEKNTFGLIQSRIKLKTSAEAVSNSFVRHREANNSKIIFSFDKSCVFYIKRKEAAFPYLGVVLNNADILIPQR